MGEGKKDYFGSRNSGRAPPLGVWHRLISPVYMISTRVNGLISEKGSENSTDQVIKRSKEIYGYTPEEKSDENMEWMLANGYLQKKRHKRGTRGRRTKTT